MSKAFSLILLGYNAFDPRKDWLTSLQSYVTPFGIFRTYLLGPIACGKMPELKFRRLLIAHPSHWRIQMRIQATWTSLLFTCGILSSLFLANSVALHQSSIVKEAMAHDSELLNARSKHTVPTKGTHSSSLYGFTMDDIDGNPRSLNDFKGQVMMIVNTASLCGNTPQYAGLQALYARYRDQGFTILAFPANDFGEQEPGTNNEIAEFCYT